MWIIVNEHSKMKIFSLMTLFMHNFSYTHNDIEKKCSMQAYQRVLRDFYFLIEKKCLYENHDYSNKDC